MLYHMELSVGGQQFIGKGRTRQLAKHDAAAKALKVLHKEPILQQLPMVGKEVSTHPEIVLECLCAVLIKHCFQTCSWQMNGEPEEENLNKSEISQVFEIALKRNLPVNFEVISFSS